jgi:type 1 glutamine amidotransferase
LAHTVAAGLPAEIAASLKELQAYETGASLKPVKAVEAYAVRVMHDPAARTELAVRLAAALNDAATKPDAVAYLCRELGRVGGDAEVPALARLLADGRHSDAARLALQSIPGPSASKALLDALPRLSGRARIGVIDSLAVRRVDAAVPAVMALATDADAAVAGAAVRALGVFGTQAAAAALANSTGPASREAKIDCALGLASRGDRATALALVQPLVAADGSPADRVAALSALARIEAGAAMEGLIAAACGADDFVAESAIGILAQTSDTAGARAMTAKLGALAPRRKALMLDALARRGDATVLPAVRPLLRDPDEAVREAAAGVLCALGGAEDVDGLAAAAAGGSKASAAALASMKAAAVDAAILAAVPRADASSRAVLIEAAVARRSSGACAVLAAGLSHADAGVQAASARGLSVVGTANEVPGMLAALRTASGPVSRELEMAVIAVGRRAGGGAGVAKRVSDALAAEDLPDAGAASLLRILAGLGGPEALQAVRARTGSPAGATRDAAIRALAAWSGPEALPDLLLLAKDAGAPVHRALALRGLLRLAASAPKPLEWLGRAAPLATDADSRRALCSALGETSGPAALRMALDLAKDKEVAAEASLAAVAIAKKLIRQDAPSVEAAMNELVALKPGAPAEPQARALIREAKGQTAAKTMSSAERAARVAEIAKTLPAGQTLSAYLDCGAEAESPEGPQRLRIGGARPYFWDGAAAVADVPSASVAFSDAEVAIQVIGLDAKRAYRLMLAWWDFDGNGRKQSVWVMRDRALPPADLPSGRAGKGPARVGVDLPGADGDLRIGVRREGSGNVVVGEAWLIDVGPAGVAPAAAPAAQRKRVLLATGLEYPGHKWKITAPLLREAMAADPRLAVEVSEDPRAWGAADLKGVDAIALHYMNWEDPGPGAAARENLRAAVSNGTGLVLVHFACGAFQGWPEFGRIAGRVWNPKLRGHDPRGPFRVIIADRDHPVTAGLSDFDTEDELYTCLDGGTPIRVLATATSKVDSKVYPMAFVLEYGKGRVFHCVLGHDAKAFEAKAVGDLYRRGTAWAAGLKPE